MTGLWRRAQELFRRSRLDREAAEELAHHVEMAVARKVRAGVDPAEARRQTRLELGSVDAARELMAEARTAYALEQCWREAKYGMRALRRSPGLSALSIATMATGIGFSAILFALVDGIILRPLPYPDPDRLVRIFDINPQAGIDRAGAASGNIDDWRGAPGFDGLAGYYAMGRTLSVGDEAEVVIAAQVTEDFFPLIGVRALVGRTFTAEETQRADFNGAAAPIGPDPVVVLSYAIWRQRFGGDPGVVGRTVMLERRPFTIVGVMPDGFALPDPDVRLWIPWGLSADRPRDQHYLGAMARLADGVSLRQAEDQLNAVARELGEAYPATNRGWGVRLSPLHTETVGDIARVLWLLAASVGLVLLVACANVALLSLLRGLDRAQEAAVRLALGASRSRLLREFFMESSILALCGGALGVAVAVAGLRVLPRLSADLPRLDEVTLDARVLVFIVAITLLSAVLSGLPQAWRRSRQAPVTGLAEAAMRVTEGRSGHLLRDAIVVGQVALAVALMACSGLLVRSYLLLRGVDAGFDPRGVIVAPVFLDSQAYGSGARTRAYYQTLFERLGGIPGVVAVGGATAVPTSPLGPDFERPVWPDGTAPDSASRTPAAVRMATPGYFRALGMRIAAGRFIDDRDRPESPRVIMVNETLARRVWPGASAVGRQLVVDYSISGTYAYEVVGVLGDVRFYGPRREPVPEIYVPHAQRPYLILNVVIRTTGDPRALIPAAREAMKAIDSQKPPHGFYPLADLMGATYRRDRQVMTMLTVFACTAVGLALLSVYGVLSHRVRERSREIGIRIALGADASRLIGWVSGAGARLIGVGAGAGFVAAWLMGRMLEGLLFGVAPADALTAVVVAALLIAIGLVATVIPSWRATRIDPVAILRRG